jgi:hypothetical protein
VNLDGETINAKMTLLSEQTIKAMMTLWGNHLGISMERTSMQ